MTTNTVPGSQRARRPDTRPAEIMEAALEVFSTNGFQATSLEEVADAAGVTKGAIYHYFKGKEDLLRQAMNYWLDSHILPLGDVPSETEAPASARLRLMLRHMWERWMDPKTFKFLRLLEGELVIKFPNIVKKWQAERVLPVFQSLIDVVEDGQRAGEFRKDLDAPVVVHFMTMGINKVAAVHFHNPDMSSLKGVHSDRIIDSVMDMLFRGIRAGGA